MQIDEPLAMLPAVPHSADKLDHAIALLDNIRDVIIRETNRLQTDVEGWVYRGEPRAYARTSSLLFRHYPDVRDVALNPKDPNLRTEINYNHLGRRYMQGVARLLGDNNIDSVEGRFRHAGGLSNKIDFTKDVNVALFFACRELPDDDGRIIMLNTERMKAELQDAGADELEVAWPTETDSATGAQASVLVGHPRGYLPTDTWATREVAVSSGMKPAILTLLKAVHGVDNFRVFPRLEDFARRSGENKLIHQDAAAVLLLSKHDELQELINSGKTSVGKVRRIVEEGYRAAMLILDSGTPYYFGICHRFRKLAEQFGIAPRRDSKPTSEIHSDWTPTGIPRIVLAHNRGDATCWCAISSTTGYSYRQEFSTRDIVITIPDTFLHPEQHGKAHIRIGCEGYIQREHPVVFNLSGDRTQTITVELAPQEESDPDDPPLMVTITTRVDTTPQP